MRTDNDGIRHFHVLNLGAGVQSTTLYLLAKDRELCDPVFPDEDLELDAAVFADTQEEPGDVYKHLEWLKSLDGPPLYVRTVGKLGDDLKEGKNSTGQRFAPIPAFTAFAKGHPQGMVRRQCTGEYKVQVVEKYIRRELLELKYRQRIPKDVVVHQYMGFSLDEAGRAARARNRFQSNRWGEVHFPLIEERMRRADCKKYLKNYGIPHEVKKSACVFCPFHDNKTWRELKENDPEGWERACEIDEALRIEGNVVNRGMDAKLYVHKSCVPLREADLGKDKKGFFDLECEGGCGL